MQVRSRYLGIREHPILSESNRYNWEKKDVLVIYLPTYKVMSLLIFFLWIYRYLLLDQGRLNGMIFVADATLWH